MTKSLPLPPRYFQCPTLSAREEQYLVAKARESTKALVDATRNNDGPVRWTEMGMHRGVQMYKGEARHPETVVGDPITYGCGATTLQASLDEVAGFFDLGTHAKVRDFVLFNGDMMDAQLLYTLQDPTLAREQGSLHQITVKWFVIEMPSKLIKNRDFLTIECQNVFTDVSGRRGWVRSYHSIKLPCCPDLQHEYGLVRGSFYHTGHVFIESERPGYLDVIFSAQINLKGSLRLPSALFFVATKKRLSSVAELQKQIQKRRLGSHRFLGDLELVPKSQRSRCAICSVKFGLLTRKSRCRKCGEVVCTSCSDVWDITVPKYGAKKVRVCAKCAKDADREAMAGGDALVGSSSRLSASDDDGASSISAATPGGGYSYGQFDKQVPSSPSVHSSVASSRRAPSSRRGPSNHQEESSVASFGWNTPAPHTDPTSRSVGSEYSDRRTPRAPAPRHPQYQQQQQQRQVPNTGTSFMSAGGDGYLHSTSSYGDEVDYEYDNQGYQHQQPAYGGYGNGSVSSGGSRKYRQDSGGSSNPSRPPRPMNQMPPRSASGNSEHQYPSRRQPDAFEQQQARAFEQNSLAQQLRQQYQDQQRAMHGFNKPAPPQSPSPGPARETHSSDDTVSSASDIDDGRSFATLTPQMLAQHTRQMGRPGPVTRDPTKYSAGGPPQQQQQPPPQPMSQPPSQQQQRRELQQAYYAAQLSPSPAGYAGSNDLRRRNSGGSGVDREPPRPYGSRPMGYDEFEAEQPPSYDDLYGGTPTPPGSVAPVVVDEPRMREKSQYSSLDSGSSLGDDYETHSHHTNPVDDSRSERSAHSHRPPPSHHSSARGGSSPHPASVTSSKRGPKLAANTPGQHSLSATSDEDVDQFDGGSPITNALADNFSNLLRPEDLRSTIESYRFSVGSSTMDPSLSFCESLNDYDENPMHFNQTKPNVAPAASGAATANANPQSVSKTTIVQVYQQILELTKKQHMLDSSPESDPQEKNEVARELQTLYQKLNQITQDPEVEL